MIIATGIEPRKPAIPGIDHRKVVELRRRAVGPRRRPGASVAIIGMGGIGFDVALYLLERDSRAPLDPRRLRRALGHFARRRAIEPETAPAATSHHDAEALAPRPFGHTLGRTTGWVHRAELARNGVRMLKGVEYRRIDDAGVHVDGRRQGDGRSPPIR